MRSFSTQASSSHFGRLKDDTEGREGVVQKLLVHLGIEITDEQVRTDIEVLLMR